MATILIIEDDTQVRDMLRAILERAGYLVAEAPNGRHGVAIQSQSPADLVITDIIMPEMEGLETISELRRTFPDLPIIAISGGGRLGHGEYLSMAERFGAHRSFGKPLDRGELLTTIGELLGEIEEPFKSA
jgi:YesN/AraC family two-component response regulator